MGVNRSRGCGLKYGSGRHRRPAPAGAYTRTRSATRHAYRLHRPISPSVLRQIAALAGARRKRAIPRASRCFLAMLKERTHGFRLMKT